MGYKAIEEEMVKFIEYVYPGCIVFDNPEFEIPENSKLYGISNNSMEEFLERSRKIREKEEKLQQILLEDARKNDKINKIVGWIVVLTFPATLILIIIAWAIYLK